MVESNIGIKKSSSIHCLDCIANDPCLFLFQEKKARIVFVNFDTSSRAIFFCEVYRTFSKQLRERYVWILTGNDFNLWNISMDNCTRQEILESAHGHIIIDSAYQTKPNLINPNIVIVITGRQLTSEYFIFLDCISARTQTSCKRPSR